MSTARPSLFWLLPLVFVASAAGVHLRAQTTAPSAVAMTAPAFVGSPRCASCHQREAQAWNASQHAHALQHASDVTVLGDFKGAKFIKDGIETTFLRRDAGFLIHTAGPNGVSGDFEVKFTLGIEPLQQYLIEMPGGRLQAFGIAWDTRPGNAGGQRWFDLYPGLTLPPGDALSWTGIQQTANFMCIDCHVTGLRKGFDATANVYHSAWSEAGVGCEACHGPGSAHAAEPKAAPPALFPARSRIAWGTDPAARPEVSAAGRTAEVEVCARCHARRSQLTDTIHAGQPFGDGFRTVLLAHGLYRADGQMQDEVFNYGSFLQSRMFSKGVSCSDCHDPHSGKLRAEGNTVCEQCHQAAKYDARAHHFHDPASKAGQCATCHMPTVTYMIVDPRHDHSFRVPRPELAAQLGTPDVCATCHGDKPAGWATEELRKRLGHAPLGFQSFAAAFVAAEQGAPGAEDKLARLANDGSQPAIVRASAIARAAALDSALPGVNVGRALGDADPLIRAAAAEAAGNGDAAQWIAQLVPLLSDAVLAVRIEAARAVAGPAERQLPDSAHTAFGKALEDYIAVQRFNADRGEGHMNLALLEIRRGNSRAADAALERAIAVDPTFMPAYLQLANLYQNRREEARAEETLRRALARNPQSGLAHHQLGLSMVRQRRLAVALDELGRAVELEPQSARFGYVYAVALEQSGRRLEALRTLDAVLAGHPYDTDALSAGAAWALQRGERQTALGYLQRLHALRPDDRQIQQRIDRLER
jgi:predicted CXXCH cytochrome family protein